MTQDWTRRERRPADLLWLADLHKRFDAYRWTPSDRGMPMTFAEWLEHEAKRIAAAEASPREKPEAMDELSVNTVTDAIAIPVPLMVTEKYDGHTRGPYPSTVWTGAGFTLADVRRLAGEARKLDREYGGQESFDALKPFLPLLDGEKK